MPLTECGVESLVGWEAALEPGTWKVTGEDAAPVGDVWELVRCACDRVPWVGGVAPVEPRLLRLDPVDTTPVDALTVDAAGLDDAAASELVVVEGEVADEPALDIVAAALPPKGSRVVFGCTALWLELRAGLTPEAWLAAAG